MKLRYKLALLLLLLIALTLFQTSEDLRDLISEHFQIWEESGKREMNESFRQTITPRKLNQTNESNYSSEEQLPVFSKMGKEEEEKAEKALTLEIVDICSGKLSLLTVSEGAIYCLNKKFPYYVVIEKNSTHLKTSLEGEDFVEVYEKNESVLIFFIFAEDVATVSHEIQSLTLEGSKDFYIGEYYLHTIWERGVSNNLEISKMLVAIPLYVSSSINSTKEWKELKFYLNIPNKTYYLGNLWVLVK